MNREIDRVSSYYEAVGLWVNFEHRAVLLAERLGLTKDQYRDHLSACKMNSVVAFGFGNGETWQIFEGKARIGDVAFSAIASPRLYRQANVTDSGYVFRFCVGKCELSGFEEDHPLYMLDTKVVETLTAWHEASFPGQPIEENPLISSMAKLLLVPTHDWGHSWLLYDRDAHTKEFKEWGNDIYNVRHRLDNKLLINYEIITASMHKYTWDMLFDSDPGLQTSILSELQSYHAAVLSFASFVEKSFGKERAEQEENYLMYIPLSTLPCVLNWRMPELGSILERYPVVHEQVSRILGSFFDVLSSNQDGVPSKSREGQEILNAGAGIEGIESLHAMIGKGNELSKVRSVAGAQDIYPLRRTVAERLYGSANTGYRELLARKRLACATSGPL